MTELITLSEVASMRKLKGQLFPYLTKVDGAVPLLVKKVEHLLSDWCVGKVKCRKELMKGNIATAITARRKQKQHR